jgi:hypothetical protein
VRILCEPVIGHLLHIGKRQTACPVGRPPAAWEAGCNEVKVAIAVAGAALGWRRSEIHHWAILFLRQRGSAGGFYLDCYGQIMAQVADSSSPQDVADLIHA